MTESKRNKELLAGSKDRNSISAVMTDLPTCFPEQSIRYVDLVVPAMRGLSKHLLFLRFGKGFSPTLVPPIAVRTIHPVELGSGVGLAARGCAGWLVSRGVVCLG